MDKSGTGEYERRQTACQLSEKEFVAEKSENARLYITAHGVYDGYINGIRVGEFVLAPGTSQYNRRLQYQVYDVSNLLKQGLNEIAISVGDGWWRGDTGYGGERNCFGTDLAVLCQLEIAQEVILISDDSWYASQNGAIGRNDLMQGSSMMQERKK